LKIKKYKYNAFAAAAHAPYHVTYAYREHIFPTYLKSLTPICLFAVQLLWCYDDV